MRYLFFLLVSVLLYGCVATTNCTTQQQVVTKIEVVEKKVPIICNIPDHTCDLASENDEEVVKKMLVCILEQKKILDECKLIQSEFEEDK